MSSGVARQTHTGTRRPTVPGYGCHHGRMLRRRPVFAAMAMVAALAGACRDGDGATITGERSASPDAPDAAATSTAPAPTVPPPATAPTCPNPPARNQPDPRRPRY